MKRKFMFLVIILQFFHSWAGNPQTNPYIDSLKQELKISRTLPDSAKLLYELAWNLEAVNNIEEAIKYGLMAYKMLDEIKDSILLADAYDAAGIAFLHLGDRKKAVELNETIIKIGLRHNLTLRLAWSYFNLAYHNMLDGNSKKAAIQMQNSYPNFIKLKKYREAFDCYWILINANQKQYIDSLVQHITSYLPKEKDEQTILRFYVELARLYNVKENRNKAMFYTQLAVELAEKTKNTKETILAYNQIAGYLSDIQHNYSLALVYYKKILEIKLSNKFKDTGTEYLNMGEMQRLMGNDSLAMLNYNKGLENGQKREHRHTIATAYQKLGDLNYQKKKYGNALKYYIKCFNTGCDYCSPITFHNALIKSGNVYLFSNNFNNALKYFQKGMDLANSAQDIRAQILSYQSFAGLYEKKGSNSQAIENYQQAYKLAKNTEYLEGQQYNANKLSYLYGKQDNLREAYKYLSISKTLADSIRLMNQADNLARLETYFEFKNLESQKAFDKINAEKELARQRLLRNFVIIVLIMTSISGFLIYFGYRRKKNDNLLLQEQKEAIEEISKQIHESDQAKLNFFTHISHELRTPLTLILGLSEKLNANIEDNRVVLLIKKNSLKLLHLINQLLDLKKLDETRMKLNINEGNVSAFIKGILGSFENYAGNRNIAIDFQPSYKETIGYFDHDKLEKIISNLVSNAIKYNRENGHVKITVTEDNGYANILITDDGIGIPEKELKHIFNRFYRISENNEHGSGIGLALVKELVELHKGEITVSSTINEGSAFAVKLPIEKKAYAEYEISSKEYERSSWNYSDSFETSGEIMEKETPGTPDPDKKTILIAEDNDDLRQYIADLFKENYQILFAKNGEEGFMLSQDFVPDIIISDIMMPKLSGIQLVEKVKGSSATSHIPIILLTAKNDVGTIVSSFNKGADDYISKPFESAILKSRVENLLRLRKHLVEKFSSQFHLQPKEIPIEDADRLFLQKTIDTIEKHISNTDLNIDVLAMELGISRTQLYRKLKALTDYSANQFIRIIRLKRAAQIVVKGQNNMAEVMDATGFSNYSYFNNCFKELFGEYPREYGSGATAHPSD